MPEPNGNTRHCKRCNQTKPIADFYPGRKVGYTCIPCHKKLNKANYQRNIDERRARHQAYNQAHPAQLREAARRFRETQPDRHKRNMHGWYSKNKAWINENRTERRIAAPEVWRDGTRRWRQGNRDKTRSYSVNRAARERGAEGRFSPEDVERLYCQQDGKCGSCVESITDGFHVDHIMPILHGGSNRPDNLQLLCPRCNLRKGSLLPEEWARRNAAVK